MSAGGKRPLLIAASGIDGAGKSTQLALLRDELARRGRRPVIVWHRPGYSRRLDRARALLRRVRPGALPGAERPRVRARMFARPAIAVTWLLVASADTLLEYGARVRFLMRSGRDVLCDRYLLDARLDLELRFPGRTAEIAGLFATLERLCPRPDVSLLLDLDDVERRRRNLDREPFPEPAAERDERHRRYRALAGIDRIDAGRDVDQVFAEVLARVERALEQRAGAA